MNNGKFGDTKDVRAYKCNVVHEPDSQNLLNTATILKTLKELKDDLKLLTENVDNLENIAGAERLTYEQRLTILERNFDEIHPY